MKKMISKKYIVLLTIFLLISSTFVIADDPPESPWGGGEGTDDEEPPPITYSPNIEITKIEIEVDGKSETAASSDYVIQREAKENSDLKIKVYFKNTGNSYLDNIDVSAVIKDIDDGSDIDDDSGDYELLIGAEKSATLNFDIPLEVDEGDYEIEVNVEGKGSNDETLEDLWKLTLDIDKDKHNIEIRSLSVNPSRIDCSGSFSLTAEIINLGSNDEDEVVIEILNNELGINFMQENIELSEGTDDNKYKNTWNFLAEDAAEDNYGILMNVYYDGTKLSDTRTANLFIGSCENSDDDSNVLLVVEDNLESEDLLLSDAGLNDQENQLELIDSPNTDKKVSSFAANPRSLFFLFIISSALFTILIIILIIVIIFSFSKTKKKTPKKSSKNK